MSFRNRLLSVVLASLLCVPLFAACGGSGNESSAAATSDSGNTVGTDAAPEETGPKLAFDRQNYDGMVYHIMTGKNSSYEYDAEELNGGLINDAVYNRNSSAEEFLNIKLDFIFEDASWANRNAYDSLIQSAIIAGDQAFDNFGGPISTLQPLASGKFSMNLHDVPNLDLDNPWWVSAMQKELGINGKLYGIIGDVSFSMYKGFPVFIFNKRLLNDIKAEDPYALVRSGKWTLDKMLEMTTGLGRDLNGDGVWTLGEDLFSCYVSDVPARSWNPAFESLIVAVDDKATPYVASLSEKTVNAVEKLAPWYDAKDLFKKDSYDMQDNFISGEAYWYLGKLQFMEKSGDMEDDFGIIPLPKYDEDQKEYHSEIATATTILYVPLTVRDAAMTGHVMETLSYLTWESVVSAYYETYLGQRYARDSETAEMLDLIRSSAVLHFETANAVVLTAAANTWSYAFIHTCAQNDYDPASTLASAKPVWEKAIETITGNYQ